MKTKKNEPAAGVAHVIKKYPNRRLYDTNASTYITLAEIKQLVLKTQPFVVQDAKTGEDLTRSILLQIILEEEDCGTPMFTTEVLSSIIRFYGKAMHGFMGSYLEKNIHAMQDVQTKLGEQSKQMTPELWAQFMGLQSPSIQGLLNNNMEQSNNMVLQFQEQMQKQTEQMLETFGLKR